MLRLSEPGRTPYDLHFSIFNFPVRISAWFWLAGVIMGQGAASYGIQFLLIWLAALFTSILVHELGHTFAFRHFGINSHIVLYHFGGLAIPDGQSMAWSSSTRREDPKTSIIISAAGPGLQMISAIALVFLVNLAGYAAPLDSISSRLLPAQTGADIPNELFRFFMLQYCFVSIYWALVNLLPVMPLDGGNIARNLLRIFGDPATAVPYSLMASVGVGGLVAFWALRGGQTFIAIMFGLLAYSSFQQLQFYQNMGGGRRW